MPQDHKPRVILSRKATAARYLVTVVEVDRRARRGEIPPPVALGKRRKGFFEDEIEADIADRAAERDLSAYQRTKAAREARARQRDEVAA